MAGKKKKTVTELVNKPAPGTAHILGKWGMITIGEDMTAEQIEYAKSIGLNYWDEANQDKKSEGSKEPESEENI